MGDTSIGLNTQITWADSDMSIRSEILASASGVFRGVGIPVLRCLGCLLIGLFYLHSCIVVVSVGAMIVNANACSP